MGEASLEELLATALDGSLEAVPVSPLVGNVANDGTELAALTPPGTRGYELV